MPIHIPGQPDVDPAQPKTTAVVIDTPDGRMAYPQVAVAMASPDLIEAIAQAVYNKFQNPDIPSVPSPGEIEAEYEAPGEYKECG